MRPETVNRALEALTDTRNPSTTTDAEALERARRTTSIMVGYQGADDGFAYVAARCVFGRAFPERTSTFGAVDLTGYPQASHVLDALHKQEVGFAILPSDTLLSNVFPATLNQMVASRLKVIGEVSIQEDVVVGALPGTELCDADCVVSDWRTLQRCEEYIMQLELQFKKTIYRQVVWDSATGCALVREEHAENTLVLCTASAATRYGLVVLQGRLVGSPNRSRYTILGRQDMPAPVLDTPESVPPVVTTGSRCMLLIRGTPHAILDIISAFAFRGLEIVSFHTRDDEEQQLRSYIISYRSSTNPLVRRRLHLQLEAASERVVVLGDFTTLIVQCMS